MGLYNYAYILYIYNYNYKNYSKLEARKQQMHCLL